MNQIPIVKPIWKGWDDHLNSMDRQNDESRTRKRVRMVVAMNKLGTIFTYQDVTSRAYWGKVAYEQAKRSNVSS